MQQLKITETATVAQVQEQFQTAFPDLRIDFFHHAHLPGAGSQHEDVVQQSALLRDLSRKDTNGTVELRAEMTVEALEQVLENTFGLHTQVFRRSGNQWIMTTMTDHWTLEKQQREGKASLKYKK